MTPSLRIHKLKTAAHHISSDLLHSVQNSLLKIIMLMWISRIQITLKLIITQFICRLIFTIIITTLLNSIICQMHQLISQILHIITLRTSTNITLMIPICTNPTIYTRHQQIMTDIELPTTIQKRPNILLNYQRPSLSLATQ